MSSLDVGGQTILGCPISSFLSFESVCSVTNVPACATIATPIYDAACCGSLTSYGLSLLICYEQHAPTCLDTSALIASITGGASGTNPCAKPATPGSGSGSSSAMSTTSAATLTSSGTSNASPSTTAPPTVISSGSTATDGSSTTGGSSASSISSSTTSANSSSSPINSSSSPITVTKSDAHKVGLGLKGYIGIVFISALTFLSM